MESGKSIDSVPCKDEIAIQIMVAGQASDMSSQGGDSKYSTASDSGSHYQEKASNGTSKCSDQSLRRRSSYKITKDSDSTLCELQVMRASTTRPKYSKSKSRLMELEPLNSTSSNLVRQTSGMGTTSSLSLDSLSTRSEFLRTGSLPPAQEHDEDDDEEVNDGDSKNNQANPPRKFRKSCNFTLKAIDVILEWIIFVAVMVLLVASLHIYELKIRVIWGLQIWKWCVLAGVFFCGRLVTKWAKDLIVFLIESKFLFNEKVVYFVHGVKQSVRVVIWLALVLLAWLLLIDRDAKHPRKTIRILNYITRALAATLIGAVMWMLKTLLVKLIAASFHVKTFFDKIREAISHEYFLWTLSLPRSINSADNGGNSGLSSQCCFKFRKWRDYEDNTEEIGAEKYQKLEQQKKTKSYAEKREEITIKKLGKMKPGKMPVSTMGPLIDRIRSSKLSIISSALDDKPANGGEQKEITSRSEAEEAAHQIFENITRQNHDYMELEDLQPFVTKENADCLLECFEKVAEEGKITETALKDWVVNIYKERECLSHSLKDAKTAIEELNRILSGIVLVLIVIVWLLLMGFATTRVLVFFSSQVLVVVFIFGNTCRTVFEAMIFVFIMHPFDVGDRCVIDGVQMIVEEMDILKTTFLRYDNEMIHYPNAVLATKAIGNFNRSPNKMGDTVNFDIDVSTSLDSIEALRVKIKEYIEKNSHNWHPDHSIQVKEIEQMNKMKMCLYVNHKMNFQDFLPKMNRRTELMLALKKIFEDLGMKYHLLPQEVHINYVGSAVPTVLAPATQSRSIL